MLQYAAVVCILFPPMPSSSSILLACESPHTTASMRPLPLITTTFLILIPIALFLPFAQTVPVGGRSYTQATRDARFKARGSKTATAGVNQRQLVKLNEKTYVDSPSGAAAASLAVSDWPLQGTITLEGLQYLSGQWFSTAHQRHTPRVLRVASTLDSPLRFDFAVIHPPSQPSAALIKQNKDFPPGLGGC